MWIENMAGLAEVTSMEYYFISIPFCLVQTN